MVEINAIISSYVEIQGAVPHVLVNAPTSGYGIFIENMLDAVEKSEFFCNTRIIEEDNA